MNLNSLSTNVMLHHSALWAEDAELRAQITATPVGAAILTLVEQAHQRLSTQSERRRLLDVSLVSLTELIAELDAIHDSMARAIHGAIDVLITASGDSAEIGALSQLKGMLFPEGLAIVQRSHAYEAGAARALERRVTKAELARLADIAVGRHTLADWFRRWVDAGKALGERVHERAALIERSGRGGTGVEQIDTRAARNEWIGVAQTFLGALGHMKLPAESTERILGSLQDSIAQALRGRGDGAVPDDGEPGDDPGDVEPDPGGDEPDPGDIEPDPGAPGAELSGGGAGDGEPSGPGAGQTALAEAGADGELIALRPDRSPAA
ncbi:hypothetical protein [Haliangium sp.]|uniref:hypothetical protein n=1 Tax=Haliangium sp. TaxID=2663208 RepID=UPI003D11F110